MEGLRKTFSEYGLIRFRVLVECRWLQQLSQLPGVTEVPPFGPAATALLDQLATGFTVEDAQEVGATGEGRQRALRVPCIRRQG